MRVAYTLRQALEIYTDHGSDTEVLCRDYMNHEFSSIVKSPLQAYDFYDSVHKYNKAKIAQARRDRELVGV